MLPGAQAVIAAGCGAGTGDAHLARPALGPFSAESGGMVRLCAHLSTTNLQKP